jgi:soluble lytic murein transglycosylase-like protein
MNIPVVNKNISNLPESKVVDKDQQAKLLKLQKACRDFESVFIYYMLKTMRSASSKSSLFGEGFGSDIFQQMFDQGLAEKMSATGDFGISGSMYKKYAEILGAPKTDENKLPVDFKPVTRKVISAEQPQTNVSANHHQIAAVSAKPVEKVPAPESATPVEKATVREIAKPIEKAIEVKTAESIEKVPVLELPITDDKATVLETAKPVEKVIVSEPAMVVPKTISKAAKSKIGNYETIINEAATAHQIDPQLVKAVILQESGGNPKALSAKGAKGLMQLMDGTARMLGVRDSFDIKQNIHGGAKYLSSLLQKFEGDIKKALAAYNAGPAAVEKYNGVPPYEETTKFVEAVMSSFGGLFNSDKSR